MCDKICNTCGEQQCEKICLCQKPDYKETVCETIQDFKCTVLEKKENGENIVFPCLNLESGDTLLDLTKKVEELKCGLGQQNFFDEKVKTTGSDATAGFLADKVIGNDCISWTTENITGNIKLKPILDFTCIFNKIKALPGFCFVINACETDCIPPSNVTLLVDEWFNECPSTTINLNTAFIDTIPTGVVVEWHKNNTHTSPIVNPTAYSFSSGGNIYVFTKNILTGCYSSPIAVLLIKNNCVPLPVVTINCNSTPTALSGVFEKTLNSNGVIRIPVSVASGTGSLNVVVSGGGFTNNGVFNQAVTTATVNLDIPVTYDGTGNIGNHIVTFTINGASTALSCNFALPVVCKPCVLNAADVAITNVNSLGFTVNVNNLSNIPGCIDTYSLVIKSTATDINVINLNSLTSSYLFNIGDQNTNYTVDIVKKCCCNNMSSIVTVNQTTNPCIATSILGFPILPNGAVGVPYNYSFQLGGTQPFVQRPTINRRPIWMTEIISGDIVTLGGTPTASGKFSVNLAYDNCNEVMAATLSQTNILII